LSAQATLHLRYAIRFAPQPIYAQRFKVHQIAFAASLAV